MKPLPSYSELKRELPLSNTSSEFILNSRQIIRDIIFGNDPRKLLIIGPCSIHCSSAAKEYASRLSSLAKEVSSQFYIAMRVYCEKPRTFAGWKGYLYDPLLDGSHDIHSGLQMTRQLMLSLLDMEIPIATEFLDPITAYYYDDLVSWGSIGARTSASQPHRQLASALSMPIGMKNGVAGNISSAVQGAISASHAHTYIGLNKHGIPSVLQSYGNPDVHIILRGGEQGTNYDPESIEKALDKLSKVGLPNRILIDCSHGNSGKKHDKQIDVFHAIIDQVINGNESIRGLMLESFLEEGQQSLSEDPSTLSYGISITDACLDWKSSELLIRKASTLLSEQSPISSKTAC